ncbi:MAG: hypothetical protein JW833_16875, partial [Prolixibacteraceae bacterium]|nr:hypothetical protein [Prolixibacteraceae bacterium]
LWELLLHKNIIIDKISVVSPSFKLTGPEFFGNDSLQISQFAIDEVKQLFKNYINSIKISEIEFINANYHFFNLIGDQAGVTNAEQVSVGISGFRSDTTLFKNSRQPFETDDIFVRIKGFGNELSDSIHFLKIDSLEYSLKKAELKAFRSHLYPSVKTNKKSLYDAYIPEFNMRSKNLSRFRWADSLDISFLEFENPEITFTQKEVSKRISIEDLNRFNLFELIKNDFSIINIDSFYLNNARLKIFTNLEDTVYQQKFSDIDIHLLNFTLDSVSRLKKDKLLYADDIEMKVSGYALNLDDNFHRFLADSIYVSTFSDSLSVKGIQLTPMDNSDFKIPVKVKIGCVRVNISNVDLKTVYHKRTIESSVVEIQKPDVLISSFPDVSGRKNRQGLLFDLVTDYLQGVYSNLIIINDGNLIYHRYPEGVLKDVYKTGFKFALTGFSLDSTSQSRTDKVFYASDFELDFSDFGMTLTDNLHRLNIKNIHFSNTESSVSIDSLHLSPLNPDIGEEDMKKFNRSQLYDISIPKVSLINAGLHQAFFDNNVTIENFRIQDPVISYENFATLRNSENKLEFSELYDLIFNYVDNISISNLQVPTGKIKWVNHSLKGKTISLDNQFSTELKKFRLNREEIKKQKLLFSEHIRFTLDDPLFKLSDNVHYLKAGKIDFSTEEKRVTVFDALFYPDITSPEYVSKPTTFQVSIPEFFLNGIDLVNAYYTKNIDVVELNILEPKVEIYSQKDRTKALDLKKFTIPFPAFLNSLNLINLNLINGEVVTYRSEGVNYSQSSRFKLDLESENIQIFPSEKEKFNKLESGNIKTKISDFQLVFEDKSHEARLDEMVFDKNAKTLTLTNFALIPSRYGQPENMFNINAPQVKLTGFNIEDAYEFNDYSFDKIEFKNPQVSILIKDTIRNSGLKKFSDLDLYDYMKTYLNTLKVGELSLIAGNIDLKTAKTKLEQENINLKIKNIEIREGLNKPALLNSDGFEFSTFNYKRQSDDGLYGFYIDTITYSSISRKAELKSIRINPLVSKEEIARKKIYQVDVVNAKINSAKLSGFNIDKWLDEKIIEGEKLSIGKTKLNIFRNKRYPFNKNQRPLWPQQMLKKVGQPFNIDSVFLFPSTIIYSELPESGDDPVSVDFTDVTLKTGQITNLKPETENYNITIQAEGKVLKNAEVILKVNFFPGNSDFSHIVQGSIRPVDMITFSSIAEKSALIKVEKGQINRFEFNFSANNNKAEGNLYFDYDDLKIAVLGYRNGDTIKSRLNSFMANNFMVHSKNPRGKNLEPQNINYKRNPQRSILNYWWKSIFSSAKIVLGIEKEDKK